MKKILFPTDFSATADNAFLYALSLTKKLDAALTILHVYELPELGRALKSTTKEVYEMMEQEAKDDFQKSLKNLKTLAQKNNISDVAFSELIAEGDPVHKIAEITERHNIDLVIMGTKGASGIKEMFLGSITTGVIDESNKPVLSIPEKTHFKDSIDKITYLTNYKDEEINSFKAVCSFAEKFKAKMFCVHFDGDDSCANGEEMSAWKEKVNIKDTTVEYNVLKGNDFEKALVEFKTEKQIDIIAIQPRKKNIFARLFSKSVSKSIAHHLNIPLFTMPKI